MNLHLHLLILASLFHLSSGIHMVELTGPLTDGEECTGNEYAEFRSCAVAGFVEFGITISGGEDEAFMNHGPHDRDLQNNNCSGCTGGAPRGTFCFTVCGGRRRLEKGTEKTGLRHLQASAKIVNGAFTSGEGTVAGVIAYATLTCFDTHSAEDPCLGSINDMELTVTL
jgi:hypothetical protein